MAVGGSSCRNGAIGGNKNNTAKITLDGMRVSSGSSEGSLMLKSVTERLSAISDKENPCVKIEPCDHAAFGNYTYIIDDNRHTAHCLYCDYSEQQEHQYTDGKCACGKKEGVEPQTVSITLYRAKDATSGEYDNGLLLHVVKGEKYTITTCNAPEGLTFMGWIQDPATAPADYEMRDGDFTNLVDAGEELTPTTAVNLYARYRYRYTDEWTWSDDWNSATVTIKLGDQTIVENKAGEVYDNSVAPTAENPDGTINKTATYAWTKAADIVYNFSDQRTIANPYVYDIALANETGNAEKITAHDKRLANVTLTGRTLYKDGSWNTLCLPFDVTIAGSPLEGATVVTIDNATIQSKQLHLDFSAPQQKMEAGKPYLVKWEAGGKDIVNPVFTGVTIKDDVSPVKAGAVRFVGIFTPTVLPAGSKDILYVGLDGKLYYPNEDVTLGAFRAYFEVMFGGEDGSTGIIGISNSKAAVCDGSYYDLQGRKVLHPTKGLYIVNGKKVVVK
jgi:hypothetical protein